MLTFCPPELTEIDEEAMASCFTYLPSEESAVIAELPLVEATSTGAFRGVTMATGPDDDVWAAQPRW